MLPLDEPPLELGLELDPLLPEELLPPPFFIADSNSEREMRPSLLVSALEKSIPVADAASVLSR